MDQQDQQQENVNSRLLPELLSRYIIKLRVDATSYEDASERITDWALAHESGFVSACSVHGVIESYEDKKYCEVINKSRLNTPDGMPVVWALRLMGAKKATRVYGPTLMLHLCKKAAEKGVSVALYGGTQESLDELMKRLIEKFPTIVISCAISPPFRPLTKEEDAAYTRQIQQSGAGLIFVGIGCPRQDYWMNDHLKHFLGIQVGVGAAFDFHAGRTKQAPPWVQPLGLEWLFRLLTEPKRLWKRYLRIVPRFAILFPIYYFRWILRNRST
jgi:N-acetylglucosaminyldiphosphoundecaprenol N-acetyl-beta-D-mannosaminyltransferase